jgi:signal transduction histidine kinase
MSSLGSLLSAIVNLGVTPECDDDARTTRRVFAGGSLLLGVVALWWGLIYIGFGEVGPGLIPALYSVFTCASFILLWRHGGWSLFRISQLVLIFVLPFALMLSLGGYVNGSAVMLWAILAPLGALWGGRSRESTFWVVAFLVCAVLAGLLEPHLSDSNALPDAFRTVMFVMNVTFVAGAVFLLLSFFVGQKDTVIAVMRRNRELESAYLAQEVTLRQNDKLATLGKLSAGMAHELNNPTAAAQQAARQLSTLVLKFGIVDAELAGLGLAAHELQAIKSYSGRIDDRVHQLNFLDPLDRSDREAELQDALETAGVEEPWEIAPSLVNLGLNADELAGLVNEVQSDRLASALTLLAAQHNRASLLSSLNESTGRIIELVKALKTYTYLDQAPRQLVDVHEGLDSTLVMFQNRLKPGIEVHRSYADGVPEIEAYGSELNQVWTNVIDNAIDAMDGHGTIDIVTQVDGDSVIVELRDDGPGVPATLADQIFDPFVTTKAPGEGTGLGLNISHNIVTQKHGGEISLTSEPGRTSFIVKLPTTAPADPTGDIGRVGPTPGSRLSKQE